MSMNKVIKSISLTICLFLLFTASVRSHAALLTWTLQGVTLEETEGSADPVGTRISASGSFVYDAKTHLVKDWNITVAADGTRFAPDAPCFLSVCTNTAQRLQGPHPGTDKFSFVHFEGTPGSSPEFHLITPELTDSGGTKSLIILPGFAQYSRGGVGAIFADVVAGSISAVPEPSIAAYLAVSFGVLVVGMRRLIRFQKRVAKLLLRSQLHVVT